MPKCVVIIQRSTCSLLLTTYLSGSQIDRSQVLASSLKKGGASTISRHTFHIYLIRAVQYVLSVIKTVHSSPSKVLTALDEVALLMTESMNGSSFRPNDARTEKHANVILSSAASTDQSLEIDVQRSLTHTTH